MPPDGVFVRTGPVEPTDVVEHGGEAHTLTFERAEPPREGGFDLGDGVDSVSIGPGEAAIFDGSRVREIRRAR